MSAFTCTINKYFTDYFNEKSKFKFIKSYISNHTRSEYDAIKLIPNDKISKLTRDLFLSISRNGIINSKVHDELTTHNLITYNTKKKITYMGFKSLDINDIVKYNKTNTVLFVFQLL